MDSQSDFFLMHGAYATYLIVSILLTIWVARTLSTSGELFLVRCFGQDQELARSTNQLLVIGFYLVNLGFVSLRLSGWTPGAFSLVGELGERIGVTLLVLGGMHFFNMIMIARLGRTVRGWIREQTPTPALQARYPDASPARMETH